MKKNKNEVYPTITYNSNVMLAQNCYQRIKDLPFFFNKQKCPDVTWHQEKLLKGVLLLFWAPKCFFMALPNQLFHILHISLSFSGLAYPNTYKKTPAKKILKKKSLDEPPYLRMYIKSIFFFF